jgi:hypothetical protein
LTPYYKLLNQLFRYTLYQKRWFGQYL